jgi:hypothetical protein
MIAHGAEKIVSSSETYKYGFRRRLYFTDLINSTKCSASAFCTCQSLVNAGPITLSTAISKIHLRVGLANPEKAPEAALGTEADRNVRSSNLALPGDALQPRLPILLSQLASLKAKRSEQSEQSGTTLSKKIDSV